MNRYVLTMGGLIVDRYRTLSAEALTRTHEMIEFGKHVRLSDTWTGKTLIEFIPGTESRIIITD